ncbi:hypothetical protein HZS_1583, partial [Henneguya salminicola]
MEQTGVKVEEHRKNTRTCDEKYIYDIRSYTKYFRVFKLKLFKEIKAPRSMFSIPYLGSSNIYLPPIAYISNEANFFPSKFVWSGINRVRSPIFAGKWLRDGIHLVTGSSNGELSLWNPLKFMQELNFAAHESAVRAISISHDGNWIITADHNGQIKYWQPNLNLVNTLLAHIDPIRDISFAPTDLKFGSCGDDGLIKIWDFEHSRCDSTMQGHGTDVKCLDWHPFKGIIVSGSKDCQQPIMLWDPRNSSALCTIHIHKNAIMSIRWNSSGNCFASASKDKTIKIFDIRNMKELQTFRGHKKEIYNVAWHTVSDRMLSSGGVDGSLIHWLVGEDKELGTIDNAHDGVIWELSWHPEGHIFSSVSNDQSCKIWVRNKAQFVLEKEQNQPVNEDKNIDESFDNFDQNIEQNAPCSNIDLGSTPSSNIQRYNYPQRAHKYFACVPCESYENLSPKRERYPIGKMLKPIIPTCDQIKVDHAYFYDSKMGFSHPEPLERINIYEEEDDEIVPVKFVRPSKVLNFIQPQITHFIMDAYNQDTNSQQEIQQDMDPMYHREVVSHRQDMHGSHGMSQHEYHARKRTKMESYGRYDSDHSSDELVRS